MTDHYASMAVAADAHSERTQRTGTGRIGHTGQTPSSRAPVIATDATDGGTGQCSGNLVVKVLVRAAVTLPLPSGGGEGYLHASEGVRSSRARAELSTGLAGSRLLARPRDRNSERVASERVGSEGRAWGERVGAVPHVSF
jgi:hypothetical protein